MARETLLPPMIESIETVESQGSPESLERYRLVEAGTIAIFGEEGAGKSILAKGLALALNARLFEGGKDMREKSGGTIGTIGYQERPIQVDKELDIRQIDMMVEAIPDNPLVNESRLSGFLATYIPDGIKIIRINVTAPAIIRMRRIKKRALEEWEKDKKKLKIFYDRGLVSREEFERMGEELAYKRVQLTIPKIWHEETKRRKNDIKQWTEAWPSLEGKDPLNPGTRINGERLWD